MKVTFLGTGTSQGVPIIGCDCEVCLSVDPKDKRLRSSVFLEWDEASVIVDTGPDFRYQMLRAGKNDLDAVLFTHEHKDHVAGLDDIRPINFLQKKKIEVYASENVELALKREFHYIFSENKYPGIPEINMIRLENIPFELKGKKIIPVLGYHYKLPVFGFRVDDFCYITDMNSISEEEKQKLNGLKVLVLNALRKEDHISHFNLDEAIDLAQEIGAEHTYFTHVSHQMGLQKVVSKALPKNISFAYDTLVIDL